MPCIQISLGISPVSGRRSGGRMSSSRISPPSGIALVLPGDKYFLISLKMLFVGDEDYEIYVLFEIRDYSINLIAS